MEATSCAGTCIFTTFAVLPSFMYSMQKIPLVKKIIGFLLLLSAPILRFQRFFPKLLATNKIPDFYHMAAIETLTGMKMTLGRFLKMGSNSFDITRRFNVREGITSKDDTLPQETVELSHINLEKMKRQYYYARGWDKNGIPKN
jgi:aldehyde:ferredoxin oxidoreductase